MLCIICMQVKSLAPLVAAHMKQPDATSKFLLIRTELRCAQLLQEGSLMRQACATHLLG